MSKKLKPCPFCGKETAEVECDGAFWWVECQSCGATGHVFWFILNNGNAHRIAIDNWNTRPIEDALNSRIAELEEAQRWIPVGERLPEEKQNVLALDRTGTAYHWEYSRSLSNIFVSDYTHWMPLPQPPEVQE